MTELERTPRRAIDALHAELLGVLVDIDVKAGQIQADLPLARQHVDELVGDVKKAFEEIRLSSVRLISFVKHKQLESLGEISARSNFTADTPQWPVGLERMIWAGCALTGINTLILLGFAFLLA